MADLLAVWIGVEVERLGVAPAVSAGCMGWDQEADAFTCPMSEAAEAAEATE